MRRFDLLTMCPDLDVVDRLLVKADEIRQEAA
jgi:hypothetical protein